MIILYTNNKSINNDIRYLKGVGEKRKKKLEKLGICNISDALLFFPRSFEDRKNIKKISECLLNEKCTVVVKPFSEIRQRRTKNNIAMLSMSFRDETGVISVTWFNMPYMKSYISENSKYAIYGKIQMNYNKLSMVNPKIKKIDYKDEIEIEPIYPLTKDVKQHELRKIMNNALEYINYLDESLPKSLIKKYKLMGIKDSFKNIHKPDNFSCFKKARERLVFEELFYLQLALLSIKEEKNKTMRDNYYPNDKLVNDFIKKLNFTLTDAQKKSLKDIWNDFSSQYVMNRLLQGDVGSGKTVVALVAAIKVISSGFQVAMMVPTSILAMQHYEYFSKILNKYGFNVELLHSGANKKKNEIINRLKNGDIDIVVGTHSLIQENVQFKNLGLVITDEQHRFGVLQRESLKDKASKPDILVMTATPIPRTLALILYGDMDVSVIDELPKGRKKVKTYVVESNMRKRITKFIVKNLKEGRQAYIICPMVENEKESDLKSVTEYYEIAKKTFLKNFNVRYVHGKMKSEKKEEILEKFANNQINVLISTTVIEVGVNVPNANLMIIENAERYGLAQLHQLRGRVGRGEHQSYCILYRENKSEKSHKRLKILEESTDGFYISEMDLKLRGPGEFFGTMQHGIPPMQIANFYEDMDILKFAQKVALKFNQGEFPVNVAENEIIKRIISRMKGELKNA